MIIVSRIMFHSYFIALRKEKWQSSMWKEFQNGLKCYYDEFSWLVFYALATWDKETATPLNQRGQDLSFVVHPYYLVTVIKWLVTI